jgi:hypothetical protein
MSLQDELKLILDPRMRGYWVGKVANIIGAIETDPKFDAVRAELEKALAVRDIIAGTKNSGQWHIYIHKAIGLLNG